MSTRRGIDIELERRVERHAGEPASRGKNKEVEAKQQALQSQTASSTEPTCGDVCGNLEECKPVFQEEVNNTTDQFQQLLRGDKEVECLPVKAIAIR